MLGYTTHKDSWLYSATDEEVAQEVQKNVNAYMPFILNNGTNAEAQPASAGQRQVQDDDAAWDELMRQSAERAMADPGVVVGTNAAAVQEEPQPVGQGLLGNIYNQFKGKAQAAIDFLTKRKEGVAKAALHHKDIGDIDLAWGNSKMGLEHIIAKHPNVLDGLQERLDDMNVVEASDNRIVLESNTHKAVVSKMLGQEKTPQWLLTAYEKKSVSGGSSDIGPEPAGMQNGTAPLQGTLSADKGSENTASGQGTNRENDVDFNAVIDRARAGDEAAQSQLREYGLDWGKKGVYRFAAEGEVNDILAGGRYDGRHGDGRVDATNSDTPTTASTAEYRITFKDGFDFNKTGTAEADRAVVKNAELGDGYITGGYTLDDVAMIERRKDDGTYETVYDAQQGTVRAGEQQAEDEQQPSALERIPKDAQGNPLYEQADADTAWDAIVEQTKGDEQMAQNVAASMVADKEAELKKIERSKPKDGVSVAEKIAAEQERKAAVEEARRQVEIWKRIADTPARRRTAQEAERKRAEEEEARRKRAEQEAAEQRRKEQEAAERAAQEALNGVPDIVDDTPQDARARGYRSVNGHRVDRQEPLAAVRGKAVQVKFDDKNIPDGHVALIEAGQLQPSHIDGQRNPSHFIDEAQPKERTDEASVMQARKIAGNIRPEEITSSATAYTGAPTVNVRGEVIQGNNRSAALREMWESHPEQARKYKQYLMDHAAELGLRAEDVETMQQPVLVNMLDVNDEEAVKLGQFVAQDTESGGVERIKPKNMVGKMGGKMGTYARMLLETTDDEMSFSELVDRNGTRVLKWMQEKGYITATQYRSAFDSKGNLTAEAKNDLKGIMYQSIFQNGNTHLEEMFNKLPAKAQKAILATAYRDHDSPAAERMIEEIQKSIMAYHALSEDAAFASAKNYKDARRAAEMWKKQFVFDFATGESYLPAERYSNFALLLAAMYKGQTQKFMQDTFSHIYDLVQGTQQATLFEEPDNTPRTLAEAINEAINARGEQLMLNGKFEYDGQRRSDVLGGGAEAGQRGKQGGTGGAAARGRTEDGNGTADSGRGTVSTDRAVPTDAGREGRQGGTAGRADTEYQVSDADTQSGQGEKVNSRTIDPRSMTEEEKQRRGEMLRNAPVIDVEENQIVSTPDLSARKVAERWWDTNVSEPVFYDTEIGEVEINRNSVESSLAHRYSQAKLDAITSLVDGFKNAVYLGTLPDFSRQEGVLSHYFAYPIDYKGKRNYVFCRAMQDANKNRLYVHEVFVADNIKRGDTLQTAAFQPHGGIALYKSIIGNVLNALEETSRPTNSRTDVDSKSDVSADKGTEKSTVTQTIGGKVAAEEEKNGQPGAEGYEITPAQYTTKRGKVLDMQLVTFANPLTNEQQRAAKELAKAEKGWYDKNRGGFMMRSEESARKLASTILGDEAAVRDAQPLSLADMRETEPPKRNWRYSVHVDRQTGRTSITRSEVKDGIPVEDGNYELRADSPQEMLDILGNPQNGMADVLDATRTDLENAVKTRAMDASQTSGTNAEARAEGAAEQRRDAGATEAEAWLRDHIVIGRPGLTEERRTPRTEATPKRDDGGKESGKTRLDRSKGRRGAMTRAQRVVFNTVVGLLKKAGIRVEIVSDERMRELAQNAGKDVRLLSRKKKASETDSVLQGEHQRTVISDASGAKVLKNLDSLANKYENSDQNEEKTFIGRVAEAIGAKRYGSKSQYATFETKNGQIVTIRLSNHNATVSNFDNAGEKDGISIVISSKKSTGINNDGEAHVVEFYYDAIKLRKVDGKPLAQIVRSIQQALYSGEFKDNTGLAVREEVNARQAEGDTVYGAVVDGTIYLNESALNPETPIHEYTHLWDEACRLSNPELWKRGVELMKQTPVWEEVKSDANYADLRTDDEVASEVHSRLTGREGAAKLEAMAEEAREGGKAATTKAKSLAERLKEWLKDFYDWLRNTMMPWRKGQAAEIGIREFVEMPLADLVRGTDVSPRSLVAVHNLDEANLRKALELGGLPMPSIAVTKADVGHTGFGEISLLFDKESINPTDRRNKVYGEDAWTPTVPSIGIKLNAKVADRVRKRIEAVDGIDAFRNNIRLDGNNMHDMISRRDNNPVEAYASKPYMKFAYLSERGQAPETIMRRINFGENAEDVLAVIEDSGLNPVDVLNNSTDIFFGREVPAEYNGLKERIIDAIMRRVREDVVKIADATEDGKIKPVYQSYLDSQEEKLKGNFSFFDNVLNQTVALYKAKERGELMEVNEHAMGEKLNELVDSNDPAYRKWLETVFDGIIEKEGIRNARDPFTPSGERRKWESLYDEVTLDNMVNAMQRQQEKGGGGLFGGNIFGAAQREYKTIEEIRAAARERIRMLEDGQLKAERDAITDRLSAIDIPTDHKKSFSDNMDMVENITDAVAKSHTPRGIYNYLRGIYPKMTMDIANEIADIVKDIRKMSARYFEAKPRRGGRLWRGASGGGSGRY